ncbi:hypothetical protein RE476_08500 [Methanolobus mangrovi]|uniref:Uncharacterized protein n=1 Tax=Methanolobus mangrovi TaxID=3072977 RepID=A0AA51UEF0_9EURY|nr:hypothetical protein [Methanolobus mangrovi]WMW21443.1 hypothetical protein RE476_08500 [Methanolobus mangrovi]
MYVYIAILAYVVVLFLTLRDVRIYMRTRLASYRKGALKGIFASALVMLGVLFSLSNPNLGLLIVLIALFFNQKGTREQVFKDAKAIDRLLGKTDI